MKWWDWMPWSLFFECWVLSQIFYFPLSLSSRGSLVFTFCHKGGVICISEVIDWYFSWQSWFQFVFIQPSILHDVYKLYICIIYICAYKLNKQGDNIQPYRAPFPIWNKSIVPWLVLAVASWPATDFSGFTSHNCRFLLVFWWEHLRFTLLPTFEYTMQYCWL